MVPCREIPVNTKAAALLMVGLLGAPVVFHLTQPDWEILQQGNGYRFMFNRRTGEFFVPGVTGVHSPGEKLVPIASKKKSVEQQARKTINKNELGERKSKKIGFDWTQVRPEGQDPEGVGTIEEQARAYRARHFSQSGPAGKSFEQQMEEEQRKLDPTFSMGETERPPLPDKPTLGDRLIDTSLSTVMLCVFLGLIGGVIWLLRSGFNRVFQVEITCRKCGHVSKDESLDCVRCGTKLA